MKKHLISLLVVFMVLTVSYAKGKGEYKSTPDTCKVYIEKPKKKVSILLGVNLTHYSPTANKKSLTQVTAPFYPGGELLLSYQLKPNWKIYTGANYQFGKIAATHPQYGSRTWFHEVSFPIITDLPSFKLLKTKFLLTSGIYIGTYVKDGGQSRGGKLIPGHEWRNRPVSYMDDPFICDYYLGIQNREFNALFPLNFTFFIKQQLNTNHINFYVTKFKFGIQIKFKL